MAPDRNRPAGRVRPRPAAVVAAAAPPELPVLGWKEHAALPDWGIPRLRVKLDTGARSSALHVDDIEVIGAEMSDGQLLPILRFAVVLGHDGDRTRTVTTQATGFKVVRDTGARAERRPVVRTRLVCGPIDREVALTVTDRTGMNFRMILGRTALEGACTVDPSRGYTRSAAPRVRRSS